MKKGLFYCQPFIGLGHLKRSLYLCKELVQSFAIDFVYGGPEEGLFFEHANFHLQRLPSLTYEDLQQADPILKKREKALEPFKRRFYDFAITEMYPFSKRNMQNEIDPLLESLVEVNPRCLFFSSLKGVMLPIQEMDWIEEKIARYYHFILNHSDPSVVAAEEFMRISPEMGKKLIYTGFVSDPEPLDFTAEREKKIVISIGAGSYGAELPLALLKIPPLFPDYQFHFSFGPKASNALIETAKKTPFKNVSTGGFINDFTNFLSKSALSISLGGSTLIDALKARTPSLVYPESYTEHVFRTMKLAQRGAVQLIRREDLYPTRLASLIQSVLNKPYLPPPILLNGAEFTHAFIKKQLDKTR